MLISWSFLRADDIRAGADLEKMRPLFEATDLPFLLAVIPFDATADLARAVERMSAVAAGRLWVAQHGSDHRNRAQLPAKDELAPGVSDEAHLERLLSGRRKLAALFPDRLVDVYVPPWNARHRRASKLAALAGFTTVSGWRDHGGREILDVGLDVQESYRPPRLRPLDKLVGLVAAHPGGGIMLHPEIMTGDEVEVLADVLRVCRNRGLLRPPTPREEAEAVPASAARGAQG